MKALNKDHLTRFLKIINQICESLLKVQMRGGNRRKKYYLLYYGQNNDLDTKKGWVYAVSSTYVCVRLRAYFIM